MKKIHLPVGLRTFKTALAVTIALFTVRLYTDDPDAMFYAALGGLVAMDTTFSRSLRQSLTQLLSVLLGTLAGYVVLRYAPAMPAYIVGLGVLILILICNLLRIPYTITLSCIVFLSACMSPGEDLVYDAGFRMVNTAVGLLIALIINITIHPYNNKRRILSLFKKLRKLIPENLNSIVVHECFPDVQPAVELLRRMDEELEAYHSQRFFHRKHNDEALLSGCRQLAERMVQELEAICGMDSLGDLSEDSIKRLQDLGIDIPPDSVAPRKCSHRDTIVMNYHLDKLLSSYEYLGQLMELE